MKETIKDFIFFLKTGKVKGLKNPLNDFIILFAIVFFLRLIIIFPKAILTGKNIFDMSEAAAFFNLETAATYIIILPLVEEMVFRGFLGLKKSNLSMFFIGVFSLLGILFFINTTFLAYLLLFLIILIVYSYYRINSFSTFLIGIIEKHYHILVIISTLLFAFFHVFNYDDYSLSTWVSLIPRIISGFYLAYIVTKYSIWHSWFMHGINNSIPFLFFLL